MTVDRQRGIGLVCIEQRLDRLARRAQCGIVERAFLEDRREAGGKQQSIALAQGHVEAFGEMENHLAARRRASGFDETEMARRDFRLAGQIKLAQTAALAPMADLFADGKGLCWHAATIAAAADDRHYLWRNRRAAPAASPSRHAGMKRRISRS